MEHISSGKLYLSSNIPSVFVPTPDDYEDDKIIFSISDRDTREHESIFQTDVLIDREIEGAQIDIADIIRADMRNNKDVLTNYYIYAHTKNGSNLSQFSFAVMYSDKITPVDTEQFLKNNFLIDAEAISVPQWFSGKIALYNIDDDPVDVTAKLFLKDKGFVTVAEGQKDVPIENYGYTAGLGLNYIKVDIHDLVSFGIDNQVMTADDTPLMARIIAGNRCADFFIRQELPAASVTFLNSFNLQQSLFFYGSWKAKIEIGSKAAVVNGNTKAYDTNSSADYEITSHDLTHDELCAYSYIAKSADIAAILFSGRRAFLLNGAATKAEFNIAPQQEDAEQIKISVKSFANLGTVALQRADFRVFNNIFNNNFS